MHAIRMQARFFLFVSTALSMTIVLAPHRAQAVGQNEEGSPGRRKGAPDAVIPGCANLMDRHDGVQIEPARLTLAFYDCGNAYFAKGDFDRAIEDYGQAVKLARNSTSHSTTAEAHTSPNTITTAPSRTTTKPYASSAVM